MTGRLKLEALGAARARRMATTIAAIAFIVVLIDPRAAPGRIEGALLPVLRDFKIATVERGEADVVILGEFEKIRDCEFVEASFEIGDEEDWTAPHERLAHRFEDVRDGALTRPMGLQLFGPFRISRPATRNGDTLFMRALHRCHPLWRTDAIYLSVPVCHVFGEGANCP